jgi:hypothetical protein
MLIRSLEFPRARTCLESRHTQVESRPVGGLHLHVQPTQDAYLDVRFIVAMLTVPTESPALLFIYTHSLDRDIGVLPVVDRTSANIRTLLAVVVYVDY